MKLSDLRDAKAQEYFISDAYAEDTASFKAGFDAAMSLKCEDCKYSVIDPYYSENDCICTRIERETGELIYCKHLGFCKHWEGK